MVTKGIEKSKLLLHHCCAPCSPVITSVLSQEYAVESLWFNPNIQPEEEYNKRKAAFEDYALLNGLKVHSGSQFFQELWEQKPGNLRTERCKFCYRLRLIGTAKTAKKLGMEYFSTTLLISPFQQHDLIRELGFEIAQSEGLKFVYKDLRHFYHKGQDIAKGMKLYIQKYCGCMPSLIERQKEKQKIAD
jgi:predicted adenine nucleotide alpha hydrolase (AANH) superfamily ATPase